MAKRKSDAKHLPGSGVRRVKFVFVAAEDRQIHFKGIYP